VCVVKTGPHRESNPGPLAPEARIIPLDHEAEQTTQTHTNTHKHTQTHTNTLKHTQHHNTLNTHTQHHNTLKRTPRTNPADIEQDTPTSKRIIIHTDALQQRPNPPLNAATSDQRPATSDARTRTHPFDVSCRSDRPRTDDPALSRRHRAHSQQRLRGRYRAQT